MDTYDYARHYLKIFYFILLLEIVRQEIANGCGFQPRGISSQVYNIEEENLCLIGTSEIPLAGLYTNKIISAEKLPQKFVGFSHCFRKETGGRGVEQKGLYRVHQFSKVEMFAISVPFLSEFIHEEMLSIQNEIFFELGLHCRVLDMPADDLGASAYRKFDIEAWIPSRESYGEISSTSNCLDYQARRLNIRYKDKENNKGFVHTINGTAIAIPRIILCILENFQQKDKSILIPPVLIPYMGGISTLQPKR
jgi:seryl-tRNA synthetase